MKKVCFFIPSIDAGGIETYLLRFIRYTEGRMNITVVVRNQNNQGELSSEYCATGVKLVFMPLGYLSVSGILNYYRFFKANKFDSVCDFTGNFAGLTVLIAVLSKIRNRIVFYRSGSNHYPQYFVNEVYNSFLNRLVFLFSTTILANSEAGLLFFFPKFKNRDDKKFHIIRNGVEIESLSPKTNKTTILMKLGIASNSFVILHSGRLDKSKNHSTMLKVARDVISRNPTVFFVFCGKNTEMLQQEVEKMGINKNIRLLGYRSDVPDILNAADLFFFPSVTEGQPNALIEAMSVGLPFVASDIKPIKECVPEIAYSKLANPNDTNQFVQLIESTIAQTERNDYSDWAKLHFSAEINFEHFYNYL
jgi:glycosyltransferase involved in cell wall biosynthesis